MTFQEASRLRRVASCPAASGSRARTKFVARDLSWETWFSVRAVPMEATTLW